MLQECVDAIIAAAKDPSLTKTVPIKLGRLLLLLDYFIHHFSAPPQELIKQVESIYLEEIFRSEMALHFKDLFVSGMV